MEMQSVEWSNISSLSLTMFTTPSSIQPPSFALTARAKLRLLLQAAWLHWLPHRDLYAEPPQFSPFQLKLKLLCVRLEKAEQRARLQQPCELLPSRGTLSCGKLQRSQALRDCFPVLRISANAPQKLQDFLLASCIVLCFLVEAPAFGRTAFWAHNPEEIVETSSLDLTTRTVFLEPTSRRYFTQQQALIQVLYFYTPP